MALNVTLGQLIEDVQHEADMSATPNAGQNFRANIAYRLRTEQEKLYEDFAWPHMKGTLDNSWFDKETVAGQRYYNYPSGMDAGALPVLFRKHGNVFAPVARGITPDDYTSFDSDADVGADPVRKWRPHTAAQFEVWPIPQTDGLTLRFTGRRSLRPLLADSDQCDLDSNLLVLRVAERIVRRRSKEQADELKKAHTRLYAVLKSNQMNGTDFTLGGSVQPAVVDPNERVIAATRIETS